MKNKFIKLLGGALTVTALTTPVVHAEIAANVAIQSDYVWRGISQNAEDPSIQGGFDYTHESGFTAGIWGASVDFGGAESTEMDVYAGWGTEFENGLGVSLGLIEYTYHGQDGASDSNFTEYHVGLSYAGFGVTYFVGDEFDDNVEVTYGYDFDSGLSFAATYGDYDSYSYYQFGVSGEVAELGVDLSYWSTDIDDIEVADGRVVLTISKEF
jgi:uncharacterized protein (TIGR02001 family)